MRVRREEEEERRWAKPLFSSSTISHSTSALRTANCTNKEKVLFRKTWCNLTLPSPTFHILGSHTHLDPCLPSVSVFVNPPLPHLLFYSGCHTQPSISFTFNGRPLPLGSSLHPQLSILITESTFPLTPPISQFTESWGWRGRVDINTFIFNYHQ